MIDRLTGSDKVNVTIEGNRLGPLSDERDRGVAGFRESRKAYLLYR